MKIAYGHFVREPLRTYARDEVQRRNGLEVKDALIPIGDAVLGRIRGSAANSPFVITSVVVGNVRSRPSRRSAGPPAPRRATARCPLSTVPRNSQSNVRLELTAPFNATTPR